MPQNYNDTIHKMATPFEMRAGLPKKEPKMLEDWEKNHVYEKMIEHNADLPRFVLHPHGYCPEQDHQGYHHP